ncbi:MAG: filamentous hemagglutinin N-terminal domain-containing protein [Comamonadaceae bacterium]|nr:MAG: filamentous hemagglutinin N-terminal domain-containing protein [Comamonadaceae bacterium]
MNHVYRTVFNRSLGVWQAVAETASGRGKSSSKRAGAVLLAGALIAAPAIALDAGALPGGGSIGAGSGIVSQSGSAMTINQQSQNLSINWKSFNVGANASVTFNQPGSSAIALNRVVGVDPSQVMGRINANGQVWLLNPNGVLFGSTAQMNVGGLVASTLGLSDADFLSGKRTFAGSGGSVTNQGSINAGYVALLGGQVKNEGVIVANMGTAALAAGDQVTLDFAGDKLLNVVVDQGALKALADNRGLVQADGGSIIMTAKARDALMDTAVNNTGMLRARTVENRAGRLLLLGDMDTGTVNVGGTLDASAPAGGNSGFIETSAAHVKVADNAAITTRAGSGANGTWLIDPVDFNVAATGGDMTGAALSAALNGGNVTIQSTNGASGTAGNVNVDDTVSWSANKLTLNAQNNINLRAQMNGSGTAGLALEYGQGAVAAGNTSTYNVRAPVNLASTGSFRTKQGSDGAVVDYTIITGLGAPGSTTGTDLQGINGNLSGNYVLGANVDATSTATWNYDSARGVYSGFLPIGLGGTNTYLGRFDGLGHVIDGLKIDRQVQLVALFGRAGVFNGAGATFANVGLTNVDIRTSVSGAAGLLGYALGATTVTNAFVEGGTVSAGTTGESIAGGLVAQGSVQSVITGSHASVDVSVTGRTAGGLVGNMLGNIYDSWASGNVTGVTAVGGLVGSLTGANLGGSNGYVQRSYATGNVTATSTSDGSAGGLIGVTIGPYLWISESFATGNVTGGYSVGGLIGEIGSVFLSDHELIATYATGNVSGIDKVGGLVGRLSGSGDFVSFSYATGHVSASATNAKVGGLFGMGSLNPNQPNAWNVETSGQSVANGDVQQTYTSWGLTTAQMKSLATYESIGWKHIIWDIDATGGTASSWRIYEGETYPLLRFALTPLTVSVDSQNATYNGQVQTVATPYTVQGAYDATKVLGAASVSGRNAGTYALTLGGLYSTQVGGYDLIVGNTSGTFTIDPASLTISTPNVVKTYDSTTGANGTAVAAGGTQLLGTDTLSGGVFAFNNANFGIGNKTVAVTSGSVTVNDGNNGGNYVISYADNTTSTINKAALTITANDVVKTYDGGTLASGTAAVGGGTQLFGNDSLSGGIFGFTDRNFGLGSKTVTVAGVSVDDGNGGNNYAVSYANNTTSTIDKAALTLTAKDVVKTYDGGTLASGTAAVGGGTQLFGTDSISGGSFAFTDRNFGLGNKTVTVGGVTVSDGNGGNNYAVAYAANTTSTINKAALTLTANDVVKTYDGGTFASGTAAVGGGTQLFGTDSISGGSFAFTDRNFGVGNKTVTVGGVTVSDGNGGNNYTVSYASNSASTINKAALTITANDVVKTYDGGTLAGGTAAVGGGTQLFGTDSITGGSFAFADKNYGLGNKIVTVGGVTVNDGNGGSNYAVSYASNTTSTINKAALTVTANDVVKTYDGGTLASGTAAAAGGTQLFGSDSLSGGSFAFTDKNYGLGNKTVTVAGATVNDGNGGSNYAVSYADNTTSTINKAALTITANDVVKTYDGSTLASGAAAAGGGTQLFGADSLSGGSFAFTDRNYGLGNKTVTVGGVTVNDGNGGDNYAVSYASNTTSTINKAALTIGANDVVKTYDGGTLASGTATVGGGTQLFGADAISGGSFAFTDRNYGLGNKTVTVGGVTVSDGNGGNNYAVTYASNTTSTINKAALTVTANDVVKTYDGGTLASGTAAAGGGTQLFGGDSLSGGSFAFTGKNYGLGNKTVTVGGVTVSDGNGGNNYAVSYANNTTSTINKAALTITANDVVKTYDGGTLASGTAAVGGGTQLWANDSLSGGSFAFTDRNYGLGNKTVTVGGVAVNDGNGGNNYNVTFASNTTSTINKAPLTLTANNIVKTYDGTTLASGTAVVSGGTQLFGADAVSGGSFAFTDRNFGQGNKTVTVGGVTVNDGNSGNNYAVSYTNNTSSTIDKAALTITANDVVKTYDGGTLASGTAAVGGGTQLFAGDTLGGGAFTFTDRNYGLGNKTVTVGGVIVSDGNGGNNYAVSYANNTTSTINKAALTITANDVVKTYDGSTLASGSAAVAGGTQLFGSDAVSGGSFAFTDRNFGVGNKTVTVGGVVVDDGNNGSNYTVSYANNTTSTINKAALTITANDVVKTYDGGTLASGTAAVAGGTQLFGSDAISGGSFAFADRNFGLANKVVTVGGVTVNDGNSGNNYAVSYANNTTSTINKATLAITANDVVKTYDGTTLASGTAAAGGGTQLFGADGLSGGTFAFTDRNAGLGNKTVTVSGVMVNDGNSGNNYAVSYANNTTSTINKAALTITTSDVVKTYDGGTLASGTAAVVGGTQLFGSDALSGGMFAFTDRNAGTGNKTVTVGGVTVNDGNGGGNYDVTYATNTTSTINKAALLVTTGNVVKTYDGGTAAIGSAIVAGGTQLFGGDALAGGTFAFTDRNAGAGNKTVTVGGVTVNDGNGGGNYDVSYASNTTSTIDRAALTVTTSDVVKTYDGGTSATGVAITAGNTQLFGGDTLSGGTFTFINRNAGTANKTVTAGGVTVNDGNGGGNYAVSYASNTTSTINKAVLSVTTRDVVKTYDGGTSANGVAVTTGGTQLFGGDTLSGGTFAFIDKNAGTGKTVTVGGVTVNDGNGGGNYSLTYAANTASTIDKALLSVTGSFSAANKNFDGSADAIFLANNLGLAGVLATEHVTADWRASFMDPQAGEGKTVTLAPTLLGGADSRNYAISFAGAPVARATIVAVPLALPLLDSYTAALASVVAGTSPQGAGTAAAAAALAARPDGPGALRGSGNTFAGDGGTPSTAQAAQMRLVPGLPNFSMLACGLRLPAQLGDNCQ